MTLRLLPTIIIILSLIVLFAGCSTSVKESRISYQMGERAVVGPLTYVVASTHWSGQLGDVPMLRFPHHRFLTIHVTITNGGGQDVSLPLLSLEDASGERIQELQQGDGVSRWLGLLRTLRPAETIQGNILFDVPAASYRLRLTDGGDPEMEKTAFVEIPLQVDQELILPGEIK